MAGEEDFGQGGLQPGREVSNMVCLQGLPARTKHRQHFCRTAARGLPRVPPPLLLILHIRHLLMTTGYLPGGHAFAGALRSPAMQLLSQPVPLACKFAVSKTSKQQWQPHDQSCAALRAVTQGPDYMAHVALVRLGTEEQLKSFPHISHSDCGCRLKMCWKYLQLR